MKKIDLGQAMTLLANVGVIAGIVFLGVEINQNTQSLQGEAYRDLTNAVLDLTEATIARPEIFTFLADDAALTDEQNIQVGLYIISLLRHADLAYQHFELGLLSKDRLLSVISPLTFAICTSTFRSRWAQSRVAYVPSFQGFLDSLIEERDC